MSVLARVRHRLARSPWMYWAAVGALAVGAGLLVARAALGIEAARDAWGDTREVVVARVDVAPGDALGDAVETRRVPAPMVPAAAVDSVGDDAVARQRLAAGEIVVAGDVAPVTGAQALIPAGWLAVPVAERVTSGARPGDAVQVASDGIVLAVDAVVVEMRGDATLVAVPADDAADVAHASASGAAVLLLLP